MDDWGKLMEKLDDWENLMELGKFFQSLELLRYY